MGTFMLKAGETFGIKAGMLGLDFDRQLEALNKLYLGKVQFCEEEYRFVCVKDGEIYKTMKKAICIEWVADDIDDLKLPECEFIAAQHLFGFMYDGELKTLRLPRCLKKVNLNDIDVNVRYLENLVIPPETGLVEEGVCTIEKECKDGSTSEMKMRLERHLDHLYY